MEHQADSGLAKPHAVGVSPFCKLVLCGCNMFLNVAQFSVCGDVCSPLLAYVGAVFICVQHMVGGVCLSVHFVYGLHVCMSVICICGCTVRSRMICLWVQCLCVRCDANLLSIC